MSKEPDYEVTEGNIFEALGKEQSEELLARAKLLHQVSGLIKKSGLSQQEVAKTALRPASRHSTKHHDRSRAEGVISLQRSAAADGDHAAY